MDLFRQCDRSAPGGVSVERAISACSQILASPEIRPERRPQFLEERAKLYRELNQIDQALADYDMAIDLNHGSARLFNARCWVRAVANRELDLALADCTRSLAMSPGNAPALDLRGFVNFRRADYAAAIADLTAALAADPKLAGSLYIRGLAKRKSGDTAGGNADIAAAKVIDPKIAERYAGYGVTP